MIYEAGCTYVVLQDPGHSVRSYVQHTVCTAGFFNSTLSRRGDFTTSTIERCQQIHYSAIVSERGGEHSQDNVSQEYFNMNSSSSVYECPYPDEDSLTLFACALFTPVRIGNILDNTLCQSFCQGGCWLFFSSSEKFIYNITCQQEILVLVYLSVCPSGVLFSFCAHNSYSFYHTYSKPTLYIKA